MNYEAYKWCINASGATEQRNNTKTKIFSLQCGKIEYKQHRTTAHTYILKEDGIEKKRNGSRQKVHMA